MPEVRTLEVGVGRVRVLEVGVEEVGLLEVGAGQRRAPQVGVVEARPPQVGVRQVELRRLRVGSAKRPRPSTVKAACTSGARSRRKATVSIAASTGGWPSSRGGQGARPRR